MHEKIDESFLKASEQLALPVETKVENRVDPMDKKPEENAPQRPIHENTASTVSNESEALVDSGSNDANEAKTYGSTTFDKPEEFTLKIDGTLLHDFTPTLDYDASIYCT